MKSDLRVQCTNAKINAQVNKDSMLLSLHFVAAQLPINFLIKNLEQLIKYLFRWDIFISRACFLVAVCCINPFDPGESEDLLKITLYHTSDLKIVKAD